MKRLTFSLACLAFLAGVAPALQAGSPHATKADARYTKELLTILQETHSVDAFVVALDLLLDMDCNARTVIPVVIRNAERLGIYGDTLLHDDEDQDNNRAIAIVSEAIKMLQDRVRPNRDAAKERKSEKKATGEPKAKTPERDDCVIPNERMNELMEQSEKLRNSLSFSEDFWQAESEQKAKDAAAAPPVTAQPQKLVYGPQDGPAQSPKEVPEGRAICFEGLPLFLKVNKNSSDLPPTDEEVLELLPHLIWDKYVAEGDRHYVHITKERVLESVEPAQFYPNVGLAQMHRCRWKCAVASTVDVDVDDFLRPCLGGWCDSNPGFGKPHVPVVYIDKDYLLIVPQVHTCATLDPTDSPKPCQDSSVNPGEINFYMTGFFR